MSRGGKPFDVIIIGGGPAGLNAGRLLADGGLEVLLLDEKEEVGKGVLCTGVVGTETFEKFNLPKNLILKEIKSVRLISPFKREILYTYPIPIAYVINRGQFDKFLLEEALLKGVEIRLSRRVVDIEISDKVYVTTLNLKEPSIEYFQANMLVLATGVKVGLLRRTNLVSYPVHFLKSAQKVMHWNDGNYVTILTGSEISKGGFGWIVPENGATARVGLITETNLRRGFENIVKNYFPSEDTKGVRFKPIAQGLVSRTFGDRVLSVGECAGQVKTTTGGGIAYALLCSEIAAEVILKAYKKGNISSDSLSSYERKWKSKLGKEIQVGFFLRKLWRKLDDDTIERLFTIAYSERLPDYIAKKAKFDWHALILLKLLGEKKIWEILGDLIVNHFR